MALARSDYHGTSPRADSIEAEVPTPRQCQDARPDTLRRRQISYFHSWERYVTSSDGTTQIIPKTPMKSAVLQQDLHFIHEAPEKDKQLDEKLERMPRYVHGFELWLTVTSLALAIFLVALVSFAFSPSGANKSQARLTFRLPHQDETIIATAIPSITKRFASTEDIGWYGSA